MKRVLYSFFQSSQDPAQVANKIKGFVLMASSVIILIAQQFFHIALSANDVLSFATELGTVAGAIWMIYGCILHFVTWVGTKRAPMPVDTLYTPNSGAGSYQTQV